MWYIGQKVECINSIFHPDIFNMSRRSLGEGGWLDLLPICGAALVDWVLQHLMDLLGESAQCDTKCVGVDVVQQIPEIEPILRVRNDFEYLLMNPFEVVIFALEVRGHGSDLCTQKV